MGNAAFLLTAQMQNLRNISGRLLKDAISRLGGKRFFPEEQQQIKYVCLIFSRKYVETHFEDIVRFENVIGKRLFSDINLKEMLKVNDYNLEQCISRNFNYILIDDAYHIDCV